MTTASVQDIDSFIRLQKEKLSRDKNGNGYVQVKNELPEIIFVPNRWFYLSYSILFKPNYLKPYYNQNSNYPRQLENYMNLPRNFPVDQPVQYRQMEPAEQSLRSASPLMFQPPPPQQQQQQQQAQSNIRNQFKENVDIYTKMTYFLEFTYD